MKASKRSSFKEQQYIGRVTKAADKNEKGRNWQQEQKRGVFVVSDFE